MLKELELLLRQPRTPNNNVTVFLRGILAIHGKFILQCARKLRQRLLLGRRKAAVLAWLDGLVSSNFGLRIPIRILFLLDILLFLTTNFAFAVIIVDIDIEGPKFLKLVPLAVRCPQSGGFAITSETEGR